ncbi:MAG TPA: methyltransferase domain-containing protein [Bryobacteraceae bacterium]|jgi:tellurite methyltransferase|nr:methyltransferase domain-containing protein [Bryobacteraceae bacterium]
MDLAAWDEQYRKEADSATERESVPNPLLVEAARDLRPGRALDLACGTGRNALWLAQRGWSVTAIDGSAVAVEILRSRSAHSNIMLDVQVADLEKTGFTIAPERYDLIAMCYYFQRDLLDRCKGGVAPGGVMVVIALLVEPGTKLSPFRLQPGELRGYFADWIIVHYREGTDAWEHKIAELIARRPALANM